MIFVCVFVKALFINESFLQQSIFASNKSREIYCQEISRYITACFCCFVICKYLVTFLEQRLVFMKLDNPDRQVCNITAVFMMMYRVSTKRDILSHSAKSRKNLIPLVSLLIKKGEKKDTTRSVDMYWCLFDDIQSKWHLIANFWCLYKLIHEWKWEISGNVYRMCIESLLLFWGKIFVAIVSRVDFHFVLNIFSFFFHINI